MHSLQIAEILLELIYTPEQLIHPSTTKISHGCKIQLTLKLSAETDLIFNKCLYITSDFLHPECMRR